MNIRYLAPFVKHLSDRLRLPIPLAGQAAFSPFLVQMVVTRACNLRCGYCNEFTNGVRHASLAALRERIDAVRDLGALAVEFTGGEPLLRPDIIELVRYAADRRFPARMMISNAFLMTQDLLHRLNDAGLTHLQISVDGVTRNDLTSKVLDDLKPTLEMVARLAEFNVQLNAVIGSCPPVEAIEVVTFARKLGFTPRVLLLHDSSGQFTLSPSQIEGFNAVMQQATPGGRESHGYRRKLLMGKPAPFKCRAGCRYLYIDEEGLVHWCSQKQRSFAKPILQYGYDDLRRQFHTPKPCHEFCTVGCARTASAYDQWRPQLHRAEEES